MIPILTTVPAFAAPPLPCPLLLARFTAPDWIVLGAYFVVLIITGWWFSRRKQTGTEDYFLGGRQMPVWAVAISVLATTQSAATFIGAPEQSYVGDLTYLSSNIGMVIAAFVVAFVFIPAFYRLNVSTPYEMLRERFGEGAVEATSHAYIFGRILASGSRVYIAAIPVALIAFGAKGDIPEWQIILGVAMLTLVGIAYTLTGGIRSVIWTDVIQCVVYVGATLAALFLLLDRIPAGMGEIITALKTGGPEGTSKLTVVDPGIPFEPAANYTIFTAVIGFTLLGVASYGTDHDMVQRMLTCRTAKKGAWTAILGMIVGIPVVLLFMIVGLLLWVFYTRPDLMGDAAPAYEAGRSRKVFLEYILRELPAGLSGLMLAGLFAAGLSSVNSTLNAMSSTFTNNFYKRYVRGRDEAHYLRIGRIGVVGFGVVLGAFASACVFLQQNSTLIDFALSVMNFAYAGLLAVFFTALFTKRGNTRSVIAALLTGAFVVLLMQPWVWAVWTGLLARAIHTADITEFTLAFPWQLLIAVTIAFAVCVSGAPKPGRETEPVAEPTLEKVT